MKHFKFPLASNSFNLVGDGDDVELIEATEELFGIIFADWEVEQIRTFGELFELVERKLEKDDENQCLLAILFHKLVSSGAVPDGTKPSTLLSSIVEERGIREFFVHISALSGMKLTPGLQLDLVPGINLDRLFGFGFVISVAMSLWAQSGWPLVFIVAWFALDFIPFIPRALPKHIKTVADLLRDRLSENYIELKEMYGSGNRMDKRRVLEGLCRDVSGYDGEISDDTTFIR